MNRFMRTELLLGHDAMEKFQQASIAVFGLGGVGSFTAEALARAGIGRLLLIDKDVVDVTNINRQLIALEGTIGQAKVDVMAERIQQINPKCQVIRKKMFFEESSVNEVFAEHLDYIADAIDTISSKLLLVLEANSRGIPIISSMGAANKLDPTKFEILDLFETSVDPIAKVMRRELKKHGFSGPLPVVCSTEIPLTPMHRYEQVVQDSDQATSRKIATPPASVAFVPPVAGLILASYIVRQLVNR